MDLNKVMMIGRSTGKNSTADLPNGTKAFNFTLATNRNYKDKDGNKQEESQYTLCVAYGKGAEVLSTSLTAKGKRLYIEGRLRTRQRMEERSDSSGTKGSKDDAKKTNYITEIIVDSFIFLDKKETAPDDDTGDAEYF